MGYTRGLEPRASQACGFKQEHLPSQHCELFMRARSRLLYISMRGQTRAFSIAASRAIYMSKVPPPVPFYGLCSAIRAYHFYRGKGCDTGRFTPITSRALFVSEALSTKSMPQ